MVAFGTRAGHVPATSADDPAAMELKRRNENSQIHPRTDEWADPWTAYPAAVAFFLGASAGNAHGVHDFRPQDRDSW
jgi:hypothetical protein